MGIFKADQDPIQGNFRPRDKHLPLESKLEILRAICAEVTGDEEQNKLKLAGALNSETPQEVALRTEGTPCEKADASCISREGVVVVAKNTSSRPPKSVKVRCV